MPFFENRFSMKTTPRKSKSMSSLHQNMDPVTNQREFGLNYDPVKLKLGDQKIIFKDGKWIQTDESSMTATERELNRQIKENHNLSEENNILTIKVKLLLDMLAEVTAECQMQEDEILQLKQELETLRINERKQTNNSQRKSPQYTQ